MDAKEDGDGEATTPVKAQLVQSLDCPSSAPKVYHLLLFYEKEVKLCLKTQLDDST